MNLIKTMIIGVCFLGISPLYGQDLLFRSACQGDLSKLDSLLSNASNINIQDSRERTLLHYAVSCEQENVFDFLISRGIDMNKEEHSGMSPLLLALKRNRNLFVEKLMKLNAQANFNYANREGTTILMQAIMDDNQPLAKLLINKGADVNAVNQRGNTPLGIAQREGLGNMVELLKSSGATDLGAEMLKPSRKYLGSPEPSLTAEIFAPNFISTENFVHNAVFHPNGNEFYFTIETKRFNRGTIMVSRRVNKKWSKPVPVAIPGNYREVGPFISADGEQFYYASDRPEHESDSSSRDMDLWVMKRQGKHWSTPIHMGSEVNTLGSDWFPTISDKGTLYYYTHQGRSGNIYYTQSEGQNFGKGTLIEGVGNGVYYNYDPLIAPDESYLIFATTNRPDGLGGADLYISFKDKDGKWSRPKNMGESVNSSESEYAPLLSHDGKYLLFTKGYGDIYWVSTQIVETLKGATLH